MKKQKAILKAKMDGKQIGGLVKSSPQRFDKVKIYIIHTLCSTNVSIAGIREHMSLRAKPR